MDRVNRILEHPLFQREYKKIQEYEKNRIYCGHDMSHFLDVARIGYLWIIERKLSISKDVIYGTALVHDIGRGCQYETGRGHHIVGAEMAKSILMDCGYSQEEQEIMSKAILCHRSMPQEEGLLTALLYRADKLSRPCYACESRVSCDWPKEKKNMEVLY